MSNVKNLEVKLNEMREGGNDLEKILIDLFIGLTKDVNNENLYSIANLNDLQKFEKSNKNRKGFKILKVVNTCENINTETIINLDKYLGIVYILNGVTLYCNLVDFTFENGRINSTNNRAILFDEGFVKENDIRSLLKLSFKTITKFKLCTELVSGFISPFVVEYKGRKTVKSFGSQNDVMTPHRYKAVESTIDFVDDSMLVITKSEDGSTIKVDRFLCINGNEFRYITSGYEIPTNGANIIVYFINTQFIVLDLSTGEKNMVYSIKTGKLYPSKNGIVHMNNDYCRIKTVRGKIIDVAKDIPGVIPFTR